jgi:integrase
MRSDLTLLPVGGAPAVGLTHALTSAAGYALSENADATRRATLADIRHFSTWREAVGAIALPATRRPLRPIWRPSPISVSRSRPFRGRAAAIVYAHKLAGFEPPINESVKAVMRGIRRELGTAQKGKAPATAAVVAKLLKYIPDDLSGKRDKALILIGFAAALRRSELVALTLADVERAPDGIVLLIRQSKTDQDGQGDQIAVPNGRKLKPVETLIGIGGRASPLPACGDKGRVRGEAIGRSGYSPGPLILTFSPQAGRRNGSRHSSSGFALTPQSVALIVKRWAKAARVDSDSFSGHTRCAPASSPPRLVLPTARSSR